jgi:hypothetical protein
MTMMLAGGAFVCAWVFLCVLSSERERSSLEAEARRKADLAAAEKEALTNAAGHGEKLT